MRSPTLLPIRMNAADTSASRAIADWTPLMNVSISSVVRDLDTTVSDVSTTSTNIAIASRMARRGLPDVVSGAAGAPGSVIDGGERSGRASRAEDPLLRGGPPVALAPRDAVGHGRGRPGDHGRPCDTTK